MNVRVVYKEDREVLLAQDEEMPAVPRVGEYVALYGFHAERRGLPAGEYEVSSVGYAPDPGGVWRPGFTAVRR